MFQYGKVLKVFRPDDKEVESIDKSYQALVEMWDEVIICCGISATLAEKAKVGDFAITEITPLSQNLFRHNIVKVLKGKSGLEGWAEYKKILSKKRQESGEAPMMDLDIPKGRMIR